MKKDLLQIKSILSLKLVEILLYFSYRFYKKGPKIYHKKFFIFHFST